MKGYGEYTDWTIMWGCTLEKMYQNEVDYNKLKEECTNLENELEEIRKGKNNENKMERYKGKRILWNLSEHHE